MGIHYPVTNAAGIRALSGDRRRARAWV